MKRPSFLAALAAFYRGETVTVPPTTAHDLDMLTTPGDRPPLPVRKH